MSRRLLPLLLAALLPLAALAALAAGPAAQPAAGPVAGRDYTVIAGGAPYRPLAGRTEVAEVFAYWCPHCADLQPRLDAWKSTLPRHVRFEYVPAAFDPADPLARAFFAAQGARALDRTHEATYRAIHVTGTLPRNPGVDEIAAFYGTLGLDAAAMEAAMNGPGVRARMRLARDFALRSGVEGTPTLIVNGRYRVTGRSVEDTLRIAEALIAAPPPVR